MTLSAALLIGMLVLVGAAATLALAAAVVERGGSRASAALYASGWGLLAFIPLAWGTFGGQAAWYAQAVGAYDFAGAIPLQVGGGIGALAVRLLMPRRTVEEPVRRRLSGGRLTLGLVVLAAVWIGWLVLMEFDFNHFVVVIVVNSALLTGSSLLAVLGVERLRTGRNTAVGAAVGVVAGLAAATGACVFLEPFAAATTGLIAGAVAGALAFRRTATPSLAGFIATTSLTGGVTGLLMIGILEPTRGFFYTGSFALVTAQLSAVVVCVIYSALVSIPLGLIAGGQLRRRHNER